MTDADAALERLLERWRLDPDGPSVRTASSVIAPVRRDGAPLMLKVPLVEEERRGGRLMAAWAGRGAAPVLASDADGTVLMARADDPGILVREASADGPDADARDDGATRILARAAARLHRVPPEPRVVAEAVPLEVWFRELVAPERPLPRSLDRGAAVARELLAGPGPTAVLHGDIHHGNVLHFGGGSSDGGDDSDDAWRAIDPKALVGAPGFDTANVFANPTPAIALRPGRLARRARVVAEETGADLDAVLAWAEAWCALSAAWDVEDVASRPRVEALGRLGASARDARPGLGRLL
ncbi:aminoglycoside phosphotransferase family protein [Clavibacter michiganensis]|uniref:Streptomycin phosphotransferase n=1 Tax=Clavibacter michiganensis subsp. insidiosus TaxID=33014 RepID=A0A0D5CKD3_9MICO|nr:aminoglycoside phosphotransferase family protein [Clavibacter michiganensis]AJW79725.1 streptomycin phosphotransferase [Clavibacter michiganensis subsp. insidiosus]AWF99107.1 streptomycin phosphotransferase [Clavibacter michiganensis subsp. insidiosus]